MLWATDQPSAGTELDPHFCPRPTAGRDRAPSFGGPFRSGLPDVSGGSGDWCPGEVDEAYQGNDDEYPGVGASRL